MSLHTLANHLQSAGRGDDKVLVHMTPNEVSGLQSLAMAHGGSLTINPETGLPEAGFLSGILPMIAGAAMTAFSGGTINPLTAGLITGAAGTAMTGSLGKGLMMGLGAYGGAGLGAGLLGGEAAATGVANVTPAISSADAALRAGQTIGGGMAPAVGGVAGTVANATPGLTAATTGGGYGLPQAATPTIATPANTLNAQQAAYADYMRNNPVVASGGTQTVNAPASSVESATSGWDKFKSMPSKAFDLISGSGPEADKQREEFLKQNKNYLIAGGLGVLGASREDPRMAKEPSYAVHQYDWNRKYNPSSIAPGSTSERMYFADGGLAGLPVEQMSKQNAMLDNTRYPMAMQNTPSYAMPSQRPISQNVIYPSTDTDTTPYSGEETEHSMASGGIVALAAGGQTESQKELAKLTANFNTFKTSQNKAIADAKAALTKRTAELTNEYNANKKAYDADTAAQTKEWTARINAEKNATAKAALTKEFNTWKTGRTTGASQLLKDFNAAKTTATNETNANVTKLNNDITAQQKELGAYNTYLTNLDKYKYTDVGDVAQGSNLTSISKNYDTEIGKQKQEMTNAGLALEAAKKTGIQSLINRAQQDYDTQKSQYESATTQKADALKSFGEATARGESIGTHGIAAIPITPAKPSEEKMVLQPDGSWGPEKPTPQYQKLGYGKVTAISGWDNKTVKPWEPEDVQQVYQEVVGRKATDAELAKFVGGKGTMQQLVNNINNGNVNPDLVITRGAANPFTDAELQANAKYYWGREMTAGELANYKKANYANFATLRNALTSSNAYVDNLNKLNEAQFAKENAPVAVPVTKDDISSVFVDTLQRKPTAAEMKTYLDQKITKADLANQLKASDEYSSRLVQPDYSGNATTDGGTTVLPKGGGTGLVPAVTYTPGTMTRAEMDAYTQQYAAQPAVSKGSPYAPQAAPQYQIAGAMPNRDVNKELGLTGLYQQIAQKSPEIQQGLKFTPEQAQAMASPFANVTPGLVTLQSAATPVPYVPPTPVIPGSQVYSPALTPEEQARLSALQKMSQNMAGGGMTSYNLGGYSDGGRLLKGPGDGVSDSIPASIGDRQPARLADGEFVIPARIVSEIGNGSTDAGARKLYAMMERVQRARSKTVGRGKVAVKSGADNMLPA
jgi:hypothetical protein